MKILKLVTITILALFILSGCQPFGPGYGYNPFGYGARHNKVYPQYYNTCPPPIEEDKYVASDSDSENKNSDSEKTNNKEDCTPTYTFMPPGDYAGDGCIKLCQRREKRCKDEAQQRYESCEHFNKMAEIEFGRCIASGSVDCYNDTQSCPNTKKLFPKCEADYRDCYASCGGIVDNSCDVYGESE
ncbi:MAG: hypothetical protein Q3M24_14700 [Candidatus Electrothrix aestuarii]|uniref:Lipoprotein n=1 Tax=Candidatus Electrothrix aestuarii TaxID=3062594 RepID=A0AAU8LRA7_9BACT|nr:hypothetical protein [Candidatus Electrothrix aestuarii]